jgi:hypothetical protein
VIADGGIAMASGRRGMTREDDLSPPAGLGATLALRGALAKVRCVNVL